MRYLRVEKKLYDEKQKSMKNIVNANDTTAIARNDLTINKVYTDVIIGKVDSTMTESHIHTHARTCFILLSSRDDGNTS
jgi:hypothetical protein